MSDNSRDAKRALSAQRILDAARQEFATHGYKGATIRGIAGAAGVDASLVMQHYGSKAKLFAVAVQIPEGHDKDAAEHLLDVLKVRLGELPPETRALVRSMLTVPEAGEHMRDFLDERVDHLARLFDGKDARLHAVLAVSSILGLTITQHFLELRAFDEISQSALLKAAHHWISAPASEEQAGEDND